MQRSLIQNKVKYVLMKQCLEWVNYEQAQKIMDDLTDGSTEYLQSLHSHIDERYFAAQLLVLSVHAAFVTRHDAARVVHVVVVGKAPRACLQ